MTDLLPPQKTFRERVTVADVHQEQRVTPPQHLDLGTLTVTLGSSGGFPISTVSRPSAIIEQAFRQHAERWYLDTLILSSYFEKILHPDYQKILTLGPDAIPLILRELEDMPNDWFWALQMLTDTDPVQEHQAGDMQAMADAWLKWGKNERYI